MSEKLQKIGTITILGEEYDVAKNGNYCLVKSDQEDVYGHPIAERVELTELLISGDEVLQALVDTLGEVMQRLQGQRDLRRGGVEP